MYNMYNKEKYLKYKKKYLHIKNLNNEYNNVITSGGSYVSNTEPDDDYAFGTAELLIKEIDKTYVPKQIINIWHTKTVNTNMASNNSVFVSKIRDNEFIYHYLDNEDCTKIIKDSVDSKIFNENVLYAYNKLAPYAYKADLARYCILYLHGGIYIDMKWKCINNFFFNNLDLTKEYFVLDRPYIDNNISEDDEYNIINNSNYYTNVKDKIDTHLWGIDKKIGIYNGLIICKKGNKFIKDCINKCVHNILNNKYGDNPLHPTGPRMMSQIYFKNNNENYKYINLFFSIKGKLILQKGKDKENTRILEEYSTYRDDQNRDRENNKVNRKYYDYDYAWKEKKIYVESKDVESKDESKDVKSKVESKVESKDVKSKDVESKDVKSKDVKSKDVKSKQYLDYIGKLLNNGQYNSPFYIFWNSNNVFYTKEFKTKENAIEYFLTNTDINENDSLAIFDNQGYIVDDYYWFSDNNWKQNIVKQFFKNKFTQLSDTDLIMVINNINYDNLFYLNDINILIPPPPYYTIWVSNGEYNIIKRDLLDDSFQDYDKISQGDSRGIFDSNEMLVKDKYWFNNYGWKKKIIKYYKELDKSRYEQFIAAINNNCKDNTEITDNTDEGFHLIYFIEKQEEDKQNNDIYWYYHKYYNTKQDCNNRIIQYNNPNYAIFKNNEIIESNTNDVLFLDKIKEYYIKANKDYYIIWLNDNNIRDIYRYNNIEDAIIFYNTLKSDNKIIYDNDKNKMLINIKITREIETELLEFYNMFYNMFSK